MRERQKKKKKRNPYFGYAFALMSTRANTITANETMSEHNPTEADDVLEFLESLPDDDTRKSAAKNRSNSKDEDILDFLDELEQSNLNLKNKGKDEVNSKDKAKDDGKSESESESKDKDKNTTTSANNDETNDKLQEDAAQEPSAPADAQEGPPVNDPITSLSNWWSSSGSATVNSLWSKTTEHASQLKTRIAQEQQGITSKLNATTISDLAKNLTKIVVGDTEEVLRVHLVHDLINYPLLSYHVEQQFDRVLSSQVQGGIRIFVDEWDHPSDREKPEENYAKRHLNLFHGKVVDGEKLAFANLENAIKVFTKAKEEVSKQRRASVYGENEQAQEQAQGQAQDRGHGHGHEHEQVQEQEQEQDGRISDVFVSILPIAVPDKGKQHEIVTTDSSHQGNFSFTIILKDITNDITSITRSQGFPTKWAEWLEGTSELKDKQTAIDERQSKGKGGDGNNAGNDNQDKTAVEGEIDPSEWVKDWVEDGLSLAFGVVAQNYVVERMGF